MQIPRSTVRECPHAVGRPIWSRGVPLLGRLSYLLLLLLTLGECRVIWTGAEAAAGSLLCRTSFLLARCALLVASSVVMRVRQALLLGRGVLGGESVRRGREGAGLRLLLGWLLVGVIELALWCLLAKRIVGFLLRCSRFGLDSTLRVTSELVVRLAVLGALVLHRLRRRGGAGLGRLLW